MLIPHKVKNKGKYISFHYLRGWKARKIRKVQEISPQITIPGAKIFQPEVKTIDVDDYIATSDSWFNKNQITAEEQTQAVNEAQDEMVAAVEKNKTLLAGAQERAKTLIENYITQLGEATGVEYQVTWKYAENGTER